MAVLDEYIKQSLRSKVQTTRPNCMSFKLQLQETQMSLQLIKGAGKQVSQNAQTGM